jgi:hypothetical protein
MDVEQAEMNGATEIVHSGDYSTSDGKRIYKNTGPTCAVCHLPFKGNRRYPVEQRCKCEPALDLPGTQTVPIPERVATSLEMIAFQLGKVVKHLDKMESKESVTATEAATQAALDQITQSAVIGIPPAEPSAPAVDEAKLAVNVAKKDELLKKMGAK